MNGGHNKASPNSTAFVLRWKHRVSQSLQFQCSATAIVSEKVEPVAGGWCCIYQKMKTAQLASPQGYSVLQKTFLVGGEQLQTADLGDSRESKQKEPAHPRVRSQSRQHRPLRSCGLQRTNLVNRNCSLILAFQLVESPLKQRPRRVLNSACCEDVEVRTSVLCLFLFSFSS